MSASFELELAGSLREFSDTLLRMKADMTSSQGDGQLSDLVAVMQAAVNKQTRMLEEHFKAVDPGVAATAAQVTQAVNATDARRKSVQLKSELDFHRRAHEACHNEVDRLRQYIRSLKKSASQASLDGSAGPTIRSRRNSAITSPDFPLTDSDVLANFDVFTGIDDKQCRTVGDYAKVICNLRDMCEEGLIQILRALDAKVVFSIVEKTATTTERQLLIRSSPFRALQASPALQACSPQIGPLCAEITKLNDFVHTFTTINSADFLLKPEYNEVEEAERAFQESISEYPEKRSLRTELKELVAKELNHEMEIWEGIKKLRLKLAQEIEEQESVGSSIAKPTESSEDMGYGGSHENVDSEAQRQQRQDNVKWGERDAFPCQLLDLEFPHSHDEEGNVHLVTGDRSEKRAHPDEFRETDEPPLKRVHSEDRTLAVDTNRAVVIEDAENPFLDSAYIEEEDAETPRKTRPVLVPSKESEIDIGVPRALSVEHIPVTVMEEVEPDVEQLQAIDVGNVSDEEKDHQSNADLDENDVAGDNESMYTAATSEDRAETPFFNASEYSPAVPMKADSLPEESFAADELHNATFPLTENYTCFEREPSQKDMDGITRVLAGEQISLFPEAAAKETSFPLQENYEPYPAIAREDSFFREETLAPDEARMDKSASNAAVSDTDGFSREQTLAPASDIGEVQDNDMVPRFEEPQAAEEKPTVAAPVAEAQEQAQAESLNPPPPPTPASAFSGLTPNESEMVQKEHPAVNPAQVEQRVHEIEAASGGALEYIATDTPEAPPYEQVSYNRADVELPYEEAPKFEHATAPELQGSHRVGQDEIVSGESPDAAEKDVPSSSELFPEADEDERHSKDVDNNTTAKRSWFQKIPSVIGNIFRPNRRNEEDAYRTRSGDKEEVMSEGKGESDGLQRVSSAVTSNPIISDRDPTLEATTDKEEHSVTSNIVTSGGPSDEQRVAADPNAMEEELPKHQVTSHIIVAPTETAATEESSASRETDIVDVPLTENERAGPTDNDSSANDHDAIIQPTALNDGMVAASVDDDARAEERNAQDDKVVASSASEPTAIDEQADDDVNASSASGPIVLNEQAGDTRMLYEQPSQTVLISPLYKGKSTQDMDLMNEQIEEFADVGARDEHANESMPAPPSVGPFDAENVESAPYLGTVAAETELVEEDEPFIYEYPASTVQGDSEESALPQRIAKCRTRKSRTEKTTSNADGRGIR